MENQAKASVITSIEKQQKQSRYNIYVNGRYRFSVHEDVLVKHRLLKGETIDEDTLTNVIRDEERQKIVHTALRFISRKAKSVFEVRQKLISLSYEESIINEVLQQLQEQGYLNDREYAKAAAAYRSVSQKKGKKWIEHELKQKGIKPQYIEDALSKIGENDEYENALRLAEKKWGSYKQDSIEKKRKVAAFLMRRGFSSDIVRRVINAVSENTLTQNDELYDL